MCAWTTSRNSRGYGEHTTITDTLKSPPHRERQVCARLAPAHLVKPICGYPRRVGLRTYRHDGGGSRGVSVANQMTGEETIESVLLTYLPDLLPPTGLPNKHHRRRARTPSRRYGIPNAGYPMPARHRNLSGAPD